MKDVFKPQSDCDGHDGQMVTRPVSRRTFIEGSAALIVSTPQTGSAAGWMVRPAVAGSGPDIAVIKGADYYQSRIKAVEILDQG